MGAVASASCSDPAAQERRASLRVSQVYSCYRASGRGKDRVVAQTLALLEADYLDRHLGIYNRALHEAA